MSENTFPGYDKWDWSGASLRDYFAGQALHVLTGDRTWAKDDELARECYAMADAMLLARAASPGCDEKKEGGSL